MSLPTADTIGILADNLRIRKSVLPISKRYGTRWAQGLDLPRGGSTVLYTGMMYQLIPYIEAMNKAREKMEDSWLANFTRAGRTINQWINISAFMAAPSRSLQEACNKTLADIVQLLRQAGVEIGYLYEDDLYSGALVHDLGVDEVFEAHAQLVYSVLKRYGVKEVITVDPHTTNMLRSVYPSVVKGYDIHVKSYLEVLVDRGLRPLNKLEMEVAIHDSCVYARYENVLSEQRTLLENAGMTVREPMESGKYTNCCGGPAESLFPKKATANAKKRVEQIKQAGPNAVTMCPICYVNLQKAADGDIHLADISSFLVQAYCRPVE